MKFILNTIYYSVFLVIVTLALLLVASFFPFDSWYQVKVVLSGSMEPHIPVGSVVFIKPEPRYAVGDVVTFGRDTRTEIPVTHRVVEVISESRASQTFITKGDANGDNDPGTVTSRDVIGRVWLTIPYLGFALEFAKTPLGFVFLVVIPGSLIAISEFYKIVRELWSLNRKRRVDSNELSA